MMRVRPTSNDGRTVEIDTQYLKATIVDGEVAVWVPKQPTPPKIDMPAVNARLAVCRECPKFNRYKETARGWPLHQVKCAKSQSCSSRVSLINGRCPERKW